MVLSNDQMKAGRYLRWYKARKMVRDIQSHLLNGGIVTVATHLHAWHYKTPAHATMFKATRTGAYVQRRKNWDCIDYCAIVFN